MKGSEISSATGKTSFVTGEEAKQVLKICAEHNGFVQLYFASNNYGCGATIWTIGPKRVTLMLDADADPALLSVFALCSTYFVEDGLAYLGLSRMVGINRGPNGMFLVDIELPETFSCAEPRSAPRVPVPKDCGLVTFLFHNNELYRARPVNVSLGGMLVDVGQPIPDVEIDSVIQVQARWDNVSLTLPALVRWREAGSYGLFFNTVAEYGQPGSCPELLTIVQRLMDLQSPQEAA